MIITSLFLHSISFTHHYSYGRRISTNVMKLSSVKNYLSIISPCVYEEDIKKSKFIAHVSSATTIEQALMTLDVIKDTKATHNCWAFRSLNYERCSDDGELSGTAGRPILASITAENVTNCMVIVTRHFGGIKLGSGGLTRAYASVAREGVKRAEKIVVVPCVNIKLYAPIDELGNLYQAIRVVESCRGDVERIHEEYLEMDAHFFCEDIHACTEVVSAISISMRCSNEAVGLLHSHVSNLCKGRSRIVMDD